MQYTTISVCGTAVRLTNVIGSGHTLLTIASQPELMFNPDGQTFVNWHSEHGQTVQADWAPEFLDELLRQLGEHNARRLAQIQQWRQSIASQ